MSKKSTVTRLLIQPIVNAHAISSVTTPSLRFHPRKYSHIFAFFHGRHRKFGVATLLAACLFMGAWLRSFVAPDYLDFLCDNDTFNRLVSSNGKIDWERFRQSGAKRLSRIQFSNVKTILDYDKDRIFELRWTFLGFEKGEYRSERLELFKSANPDLPFESITQSVWIIPYWSIVIPLTLLSAVLLLGKPRPYQLK